MPRADHLGTPLDPLESDDLLHRQLAVRELEITLARIRIEDAVLNRKYIPIMMVSTSTSSATTALSSFSSTTLPRATRISKATRGNLLAVVDAQREQLAGIFGSDLAASKPGSRNSFVLKGVHTS
jgi:hypothetical protein